MTTPDIAWSAHIRSAVFCDDVRREVFGKDIIIGTYSEGIVVPSFPVTLRICTWMEYVPRETGNIQVKVRSEFAAQRTEILVDFHVQNLPGVVAFYTPPFHFFAHEPSLLRVSVAEPGGEFIPVREAQVLAASVLTSASGPAPRS